MYNDKSRGTRRKALAVGAGDGSAKPQDSGTAPRAEQADPVFEGKRKTFRIAWAALLSKVWGVEAMACPRCATLMKVVSAITQPPVIERILKHAGLFDIFGTDGGIFACEELLHGEVMSP